MKASQVIRVSIMAVLLMTKVCTYAQSKTEKPTRMDFENARAAMLNCNPSLKDVYFDWSTYVLTQHFEDGSKTESYLKNLNWNSYKTTIHYYQNYDRYETLEFTAFSNQIGSIMYNADGTTERRIFARVSVDLPFSDKDVEYILLLYIKAMPRE